MKKLSVILPIYKVEPYIGRCLRSLVNQDIPEESYEIICVNDGSPDGSRDIVIDYRVRHSNIILIDQENQGVSVARNKGADHASGKYIMFIDPDDLVEENSLAEMLNAAESKDSDVAIPGYTFLNYDGIELGRKNVGRFEHRTVTGVNAYYISRSKINGHERSEGDIPDSSVGMIFKAEFLNRNNLRYTPDIPLYQDVEFLARIHCIAEKCIFIDRYFYIAAARLGSSSRSNQLAKDRTRKGFTLAAQNLTHFRQSHQLTPEQKLFLNGPIAQFVLITVYSAVKTKSLSQLKLTFQNLKLIGLGKLDLEGCIGSHRYCGRPYNFSPYLGALSLVLYWKYKSWVNYKN